MILRGSALVPGACGELVQGTLSGNNFLVTCPVNWFSRVTVAIDRGAGAADTCCPADARSPADAAGASRGRHRIVFPAERIKTAQAVRKALDREGCQGLGAVIDVASSLPVGKGMASSTADLSAACYAVAAALRRRLTPEAVAEIALSIEPSDGTFSSGIALFDHVGGRLYERLGNPFPLGLLVLDFGGSVDTLEFNRRFDLAELNERKEPAVRRALELVKEGLRRRDPVRLGEGATLSALANQSILPKPDLESIIDYAMARGAYGVNVAHSGTVAGVLLPPSLEAGESLVRGFRARFPQIERHYTLRLTGGGPRYPGEARLHCPGDVHPGEAYPDEERPGEAGAEREACREQAPARG
jgi:L-threonine kinase